METNLQIYIQRDDQQHGPYTRRVAKAMLKDGDLSPDDLAWHEGLEEWQPLGNLIQPPSEPPWWQPDIGDFADHLGTFAKIAAVLVVGYWVWPNFFPEKAKVEISEFKTGWASKGQQFIPYLEFKVTNKGKREISYVALNANFTTREGMVVSDGYVSVDNLPPGKSMEKTLTGRDGLNVYEFQAMARTPSNWWTYELSMKEALSEKVKIKEGKVVPPKLEEGGQ